MGETDWQKLFFSFEGRIGRQEFWIGWLILFVGGLVLGLVPFVHFFAWIFCLYVRVCLYSKRLHDMGKSGWWQVTPLVVDVIGGTAGFAIGGLGLAAAIMNLQREGRGADPMAIMAVIGAAGGLLAVACVLFLVGLAVLIWVGATEGQKGDNIYGPDPRLGPELFQ